MGYLNRQTRVVDIVLTEKGRRLYAVGKLDFAYFALFDDGLDYDPYSTGSLTDEERELAVESTPMLEAPNIPEVRGAVAPGEPRYHLFTAAPGYSSIPRMNSPSTGSQVTLMADQRRRGETYSRTGTSFGQIDLRVVGDVERGNPGFILRIFSSGSNGLTELDFRKDLQGRRSYDPFIALSIDDERPIDGPSLERPDSSRVALRFSPRKR